MRSASNLLQALIWLLPPGRLKNRLLRMAGNTIGDGVVVSPSIVWNCGRFTLDDHSVIAPFNVFRGMRVVHFHDGASIGSWNWISAHPDYQRFFDDAGSLTIRNGGYVTARHYLDCSGAITIGEFSALAGQRSTLQTHEMDLVQNRTSVGTITIGDRTFVSTGCILLRGASLPERSMLAAGSTLTKSRSADSELPQGLWAGTPAKFIKPMPGKWFDRDQPHVEVSFANDGLS